MSEICSICRESLDFGNLAVVDCVHIHHEECLDIWLRNRARNRQTCPICRKKIRNVQVIPNENQPNEQSEEINIVEIGADASPQNPSSIQPNAAAPEVFDVSDLEILPDSPPSQSEAPVFSPVIVSSSSLPGNESQAVYSTTGISQDSASVSLGLELRTIHRPYTPPPDPVELAGVAFEPRPDGTINSYVLHRPFSSHVNNVARPSSSHMNNVARPSSSHMNNMAGPSTSRLENQHSQFSSGLVSFTQENEQPSVSSPQRAAIVPRASSSEQKLVCHTCQISFRLRNSLLKHISRTHSHHFTCGHPSCNQTFTTLRKFEIHMRIYH